MNRAILPSMDKRLMDRIFRGPLMYDALYEEYGRAAKDAQRLRPDERARAERLFQERYGKGLAEYLDGIPEGVRYEWDEVRRMRRILAGIPAIVADNVAEYVGENAITATLKSIPNLAPPFPAFWLESRMPMHAHSSHRWLLEWGALVEAQDLRNPQDLSAQPPSLLAVDDARWALRCVEYMRFVNEQGKLSILGPRPPRWIPVLPNGTAAADHPVVGDGPDDEVFVEADHTLLSILLMAVGFLNCSNVGTREVNPNSKGRRKKMAARPTRPLLRYRVLEITPHYSGGGKDGGRKGERSLHVCRGHFRRYTDEAPLFGRITGTFWVADHVRGSAKRGVVVKDYRVHPEDQRRVRTGG